MSGVLLEGVSKRFGDTVAVDNVTLVVRQGSFTTLLGPSGCGKTTTLRLIAGFETPDSGDISLDGESLTKTPPWERDIGFVFQNYALFPHMTVSSNISFGLETRGVGKNEIQARVQEVLDLVSLLGLGQRYPAQLSGGQQQRVALARAIVTQPRVLLLDEPLSNLDAKLREETRVELRRIQQETGITALYVTHDQEEALALSDKVVVMNQGHVEQVGMPEDVWGNPRNLFTAEFLGVDNLLRCQIRNGQAHLSPNYTIPYSRGDGDVVLGIRAADVFISLDGGGCRGEVISSAFGSGHTKYWLKTSLSQEPLVAMSDEPFSDGQIVKVDLDPEKVLVISDV